MKDTSRPHSTPSSRSVPYKKCKQTGAVSPSRDARRAPDVPHQTFCLRVPDRPHGLRRHEVHSRADDHHRSFSKSGGTHRTRKNSNADGSTRERPSHPGALSIQADVPGTSLRLPLTSVPPATSASAGQSKAGSPTPGSVTAFLRSIELPVGPPSPPPPQMSFPRTPPSLRLPPLSTTDGRQQGTCTNGNDYQVGLVYKGYPFTYDLAALPDDPAGTIALLTITKSDPGAYLLVGAHYRRTGRPRAACAVIRSLLDNLNADSPPNVEKGKGDAAPMNGSGVSTVTSSCAGSSKTIERTVSVFKGAAMRPALLLLAACELDISRERPDDPENNDHVSTAHELFRAVYGIVNDGIVAGALRPKSKNALGLEFSSNRNCSSISSPEAAPSTHAKELEKDLSAARTMQKTLKERLAACNDQLTCAEDKVRALELHSLEMLAQLDASRDENWKLRQRLAESERRTKELNQCMPSAENRVWGRLKDLLFDNLGGGVRGE